MTKKAVITYAAEGRGQEDAEYAELYEAMCSNTRASYPGLIEQKNNRIFLYQLSEMRGNLIQWIPFEGTEHILELGAGAGALTELFVQRGASVDAIEPSVTLAECNAVRNGEASNLRLFAGNLSQAVIEWDCLKPQSYDVIVLVGALERPDALMGRPSTQSEVLALVEKYLKPDGRLIVSMTNRFGLKYWAGCADTQGTYFGEIEGSGSRTVSGGRTRQEFLTLLETAGFTEHSMYYPYPDWDFMNVLYSDEYLPDEGELRTNLRNYDADRYLLFDERKVYGTLLKEGIYPMYANAFLVIASKGRK